MARATVPEWSFIQASPPGHGPGPHTHPYAEVFVLHEGSGSFLAGDTTIEASGGSVVVVPPGEVHGSFRWRQVIRSGPPGEAVNRMITEWCEPADG